MRAPQRWPDEGTPQLGVGGSNLAQCVQFCPQSHLNIGLAAPEKEAAFITVTPPSLAITKFTWSVKMLPPKALPLDSVFFCSRAVYLESQCNGVGNLLFPQKSYKSQAPSLKILKPPAQALKGRPPIDP